MRISRLLSIVAPVLQRLVALAVGVVFGLLLLRQMSLAVSDHLAHVRDVILLKALGVFRGILVQYLDDLAATVRVSGLLPTCIKPTPVQKKDRTFRARPFRRNRHP